MKLLEQLTAIPGASSDESRVKEFILDYIKKNAQNWLVQPAVYSGDEFQDCVILVFGEPRVAVYAHMDSIGYSVGYHNDLIKIGGPKPLDAVALVGTDSQGPFTLETMLIDHEDHPSTMHFVSERAIDRGSIATFKPNFRETETYVQSPYLDNRLGVWNALRLAETLKNGALVFSTYEEHGGNSVGFCAKFLYDRFQVRQALISDITWVTDGVAHGKGVAISMRDSGLPRRKYLDRIIDLARQSKIPFQCEVESAGGSDGTMLQRSHLPIDWCFIGAAEDHVHTPDELVYKADIASMLELYKYLMDNM